MNVNKALKGLSKDTELDAKHLNQSRYRTGTIDRVKEIVDTGMAKDMKR